MGAISDFIIDSTLAILSWILSLGGKVSGRVTRNISSHAMLYMWLFHLALIGIALGGTWSMWAMPFGDFMLGMLMLSGGILILAETLLQQGFDTENVSFWTGAVTGVFGSIYGFDLMTYGGVVQEVFGGVQGGILLFMFVILTLEGYSNHDMFK